jgi:hypothetical protein
MLTDQADPGTCGAAQVLGQEAGQVTGASGMTMSVTSTAASAWPMRRPSGIWPAWSAEAESEAVS